MPSRGTLKQKCCHAHVVKCTKYNAETTLYGGDLFLFNDNDITFHSRSAERVIIFYILQGEAGSSQGTRDHEYGNKISCRY